MLCAKHSQIILAGRAPARRTPFTSPLEALRPLQLASVVWRACDCPCTVINPQEQSSPYHCFHYLPDTFLSHCIHFQGWTSQLSTHWTSRLWGNNFRNGWVESCEGFPREVPRNTEQWSSLWWHGPPSTHPAWTISLPIKEEMISIM